MSTISSFEPAACPEPGGRRMKFQEPRSSGVKCNTPLRQLVKNVPAVGRETLVQEVRQMLADQPPMSSVAATGG